MNKGIDTKIAATPSTARTLLTLPVFAVCGLFVVYGALFGYLVVAQSACSGSRPVGTASWWAIFTMIAFPPAWVATILVFAVCFMVWMNNGYRLSRVIAYTLGISPILGVIAMLVTAVFGWRERCSIGF